MIRDEYLNRTEPIDWDEWQTMRANSYEREHLMMIMTDDCLVKVVENNYLPNCTPLAGGPHKPAITYDESLIHKIVPELLLRLKANDCVKTVGRIPDELTKTNKTF